jgi:cyclic pyranopterin phosphate synthase
MKKNLSHVDAQGNPMMVDVSAKASTRRLARAQAIMWLGPVVMAEIRDHELVTKKGPVFQTARLAGVMGAKRTADLIPLTHPLGLEDCQITIEAIGDRVHIESTVVTTGKTGVEMEALTAVTVAALTIYDMCKALSQQMVVEQVRLLEKTGGKKDYHLPEKH